MTEAEGFSLKNGTPLQFKDAHRIGFGVFEYRNRGKFKNSPYFVGYSNNTELKNWEISEWKYYTIITEEEFLLRKFEL